MVSAAGTDGTLEDVRRLAGAGEKILAIRLHRTIQPTGLREAKAAVEGMIASSAQPPLLSGSAQVVLLAMDEVKRLAQRGDKIAAIKRYREINRAAGLQEAKAAVEKLLG